MKNGLTVIYGDNSSGKSSYARVLKHSCNTRGSYPQISKNLFDSEISKLDQLAEIHFKRNTTLGKVSWKDNEIDSSDLKAVDVFDSNSAIHYIENEDEIAFIPSDLALLEKLANCLQELEQNFNEEINKLELRRFNYTTLLSEITSENQNVIQELSHDTDITEVRAFVKLSESEEEELKILEKKLLELKTNDPKKIIEKNTKKIARYKVLQNKIQEIETNLNDDAIEKIARLSNDLVNTRNKKKTINDETFSDIEFENMGSDIWKELWFAAKKFIEENDGIFPSPTIGDKCPLCIQDLDDKATSRLLSFQKYLKNETEKEYSQKRTALGTAFNELKKLVFEFPDFEETKKELSSEVEGFNECYTLYLPNAKTICTSLIENIDKPDFLNAYKPDRKKSPTILIKESLTKIEEENKDLQEKSIDEEINKVTEIIENFKSHGRIAKYKPQLIKEVLRLRKIKALKECIKECNTRPITLLSNKISKENIHEKLKDAFSKELDKLGFRNIKVSLETKGGKGKQYNYLSLSEDYGSATKLKTILSEGEHRCIALATFFSELAIADHNSCIVFDDPVTSLDHKWRNRIAKRIIEESKVRQVVLFTHDITFLMNLQEHSSKLDTEIHVRSLTRKRIETGIVIENPPWDATSVKVRLGILNSMAQDLLNIYNKETEEVYKIAVKRFYGKLRETWERFIEEDFLNQTVTRFGREIQTSRLKKVVKLKEQDYWVIDENMKKCSTYFNGHDTAGKLIEETRSVEEIKEDIEIFKTFRLEIINKRK